MLSISLFINLLHYIVDYFSDVSNYKPVQNLNICIRDIYTNNDRISNLLHLMFYLLFILLHSIVDYFSDLGNYKYL